VKFQELREMWQKIQRMQVKEFKALGLSTGDLEPGLKEDKEKVERKSRRAAKREQREAVYTAEKRGGSEEFFSKSERTEGKEYEHIELRDTYLKAERETQNVPEDQGDRRAQLQIDLQAVQV
jgi:hypothetical protein